jgi:hypothetical protein
MSAVRAGIARRSKTQLIAAATLLVLADAPQSVAQVWRTKCGMTLKEEKICVADKIEAVLNGFRGVLIRYLLPGDQIISYFAKESYLYYCPEGIGNVSVKIGGDNWIKACNQIAAPNRLVTKNVNGEVIFWSNLSDF